jgi:hypothetical protein
MALDCGGGRTAGVPAGFFEENVRKKQNDGRRAISKYTALVVLSGPRFIAACGERAARKMPA